MKPFKIYLIFFILGTTSFCLAQDTIRLNNTKTDTLKNPNSNQNKESKKMVYIGESVYWFRLSAKSRELGKRTNNIELLTQIKVVKNNICLQKGFTIAAVSTAIIGIGLLYAPTRTYDQALNRLLISFAMLPVTIVFGVTAIINNAAKKREIRKLTKLYNASLN